MVGQGPGWSHLSQTFLCVRLCLTSGLGAGTVFWKGPERETLSYRETNTCSSCSTATCSHFQKASHFPQRWTPLFTPVSKFGHVLTSNYSISGRNVFSKEETVGSQRPTFCCMQRPRLKSCRDKTSVTFQTLPRKNTNDSKA